MNTAIENNEVVAAVDLTLIEISAIRHALRGMVDLNVVQAGPTRRQLKAGHELLDRLRHVVERAVDERAVAVQEKLS